VRSFCGRAIAPEPTARLGERCPSGAFANVIACWNVGLFEPRIVRVRIPARTGSAPRRVGAPRRRVGALAPQQPPPPASSAAHSDAAHCATSPPPQNRVWYGPATRRPSSERRSFWTYDHQPLYGARAVGESGGSLGTSFASSARARASSTGARTALASGSTGVQHGAPGASILPSRSASSRLPPAANQASSCAAAGGARGVPVPRASTSRSTGQTRISRRSWVAAPFIAPTTLASVCFGRRWMPAQSRSTRCTGPHVHSSSAPAYPRRLVVPVEDHARSRVDRLRVRGGGRSPATRTRRVPSSAAPGRPSPGARGSRPLVNCAMLRLSA
jgi:hypothetical protein